MGSFGSGRTLRGHGLSSEDVEGEDLDRVYQAMCKAAPRPSWSYCHTGSSICRDTPAASDLGFGGRSLRGYSEAEHVPRTGRNQPKLPDHETRGGPYLIRHPGPRRIRGWP